MTERVVVGELPVGGSAPLISSAIRWGDLLFLSGRAPMRISLFSMSSPRNHCGVARKISGVFERQQCG